MGQKVHKHTIELLLCPSAAGHRACPQVGLICPVRLIGENSLFFCKLLSIGNSFLVRSKSLRTLSFSMLGPSLAWICAAPGHAATVHFISPVMSGRHCFLGDIPPLWLLLPKSWERGFDEDIPSRTECPESLTLGSVSSYIFSISQWILMNTEASSTSECRSDKHGGVRISVVGP